MTSSPTQARPVLVAEDEAMIRQLIASFLRARNFPVIEAANGREALAAIRAEGCGPSLLITDLIMPVMGGMELLSELRRQDETLPALLVSGLCEDPEALDRSLDHRTRFLAKPFNLELLGREICLLLNPDEAREPESAFPSLASRYG